MKKNKYWILVVLFVSVLFFYGCAEIEVPTPAAIIRNPIGISAVKVGMQKDEVVSIYGTPNSQQTVNSEEWGTPREEWFYKANINILPVNAGYLAKDVYLYFDGNSLTNISDSPLGSSEEKTIK